MLFRKGVACLQVFCSIVRLYTTSCLPAVRMQGREDA